ncbi:MAG: flagellar motor switch protein FliN [Actinomycetota bacterium]
MSDVSATDVAADPVAGDAGAPADPNPADATPADATPPDHGPADAGSPNAASAGAVPTAPSPAQAVLGVPVGGGLDKLVNVALEVSVELGRTRVTLSEVLEYDVGSVVELDRAAGAPVDVRVNDTLLAQGEVVLIDDEYAVRITAIFDPNQPHR